MPFHTGCIRRRHAAGGGDAGGAGPRGAAVPVDASGLVARAIEHEIDHLDGILFLDHLGALRRAMLLKRFRKEYAGKGYLKEVRDVEPEEARRS